MPNNFSRRQIMRMITGLITGVACSKLVNSSAANSSAVPMVTWNMQGGNDSLDNKWNKHVKKLVKAYTYVCLQEAGALPSSNISDEQPPQWVRKAPPANYKWRYVKWNIHTKKYPEDVYIFWLETDPNGGRVNLAICSKMKPEGLIYVDPGLPDGRPSIGMQLGPDHVYTLHALSGGGGDALGLVTNISKGPQPWYALGDYNREPETWTPPAGTLCPPDKPTHQNGKKLDYMVRFGRHAETGKVQPEGPIWSDHAFVVYGV